MLNTKWHVLMKYGDRKLEDFLKRKPEIAAWPSIKYEWGKQRMIYGTDITSFIITNFAMYKSELVLPYFFPIAERSAPDILQYVIKQTLNKGVQYCLDYEDFNNQHSFSSMQAVIHAYKIVFGSDISEEQNLALDWVYQSIEEQYIYRKQPQARKYTKIKTQGTLFSGWR